ncbi:MULTISPECIES: restriction endonuclease subunit S [unclassified Azospirillum]|uniref:restriction endonuclease subunit S n=1 Tax=unclassified Azospirillum TaxID=2630922 RepID=UPI000B6348FB|nr:MULTISPECIES: restriction endonuclease subunit S [unclassified Azospirillum]SNT10112.1 Type I restriction modification DNA specificity domain-containing protein [Azospirillum sp. RU38E]SNT25571.1 Type I restriction modification DNA specificity domain-containing protein [Azospirillum sp. RU37A]
MTILTVSDIAKVFLGVNLGRLSKGTKAADVPLINIKDMVDGGLAKPASLQLVQPAEQEHYRLQKGDVLVSVRGTLLKTALVAEEHVGAYASVNIAIVRPGSSVRPETLLALFRSSRVQQLLLADTVESVMPGLHLKSLENIKFYRPPQEHQDQLASLFAAAEEQYRVGLALIEARRAAAMDVIDRTLEPAE